MALLATQSVTNTNGVVFTLAAAAGGGDTFTPSNNQMLAVTNGGGSPITVTVATPQQVRGLDIVQISVSVTNGTTKLIRISPADFVADPTTGLGNITYSAVTSVTVGVFQVQDN
jgi:hypothetical protein